MERKVLWCVNNMGVRTYPLSLYPSQLVTAAYVVRNETIFCYIKYKGAYPLKQLKENFIFKIRSMCNKQILQTNIKLKDFEEKI